MKVVEKETEWQKNQDTSIFSSAMNSLVLLDNMTRRYQLDGINPFIKGQSSAITDENFKSIDRKLN